MRKRIQYPPVDRRLLRLEIIRVTEIPTLEERRAIHQRHIDAVNQRIDKLLSEIVELEESLGKDEFQ